MTFKNFLFSARGLSLSLFVTSAGALAAAYISQYGFGLDPCQLCFYQRKPYMINMALSLLAFFFSAQRPRLALIFLILCMMSFMVGGAIGVFHVGVEYHWWPGLESCSNYAMPQNASAEELRAFILSRAPVRCDVPAFVLLGLSMAGYNVLLSLFLTIATFLGLKKIWRDQRNQP